MQENPPIAIREAPAESRAAQAIRETFESGRPIAYVRAADEQRVAKILRDVAQAMPDSSPSAVWTWSLTEGMRRESGDATPLVRTRAPLSISSPHTTGPPSFTSRISTSRYANPAEVRRRLRDVYESCLDRRKFVVITSPVQFLPEEMERSVIYLDLRPPDVVELEEFLRAEIARISPGTETGGTSAAPACGDFARAEPGRSALRAAAGLGRQPAPGARIACRP